MAIPAPMTATDAVYVYGIVPSGTSSDVFADVAGVGPDTEIRLVEGGEVAAITSAVSLEEFSLQALEANLQDAQWVERHVQAHNRVLAAAVGETSVLPLRFGAIYHGVAQVRSMLSERPQLVDALSRVRGAVELGVKGFVDTAALRERLTRSRGLQSGGGTSGRAYMQRKRLEQGLDDDVRTFAAACAEESHEHLSATASEARSNPARHPASGGQEMLLNGAYLVSSEREEEFRTAVRELETRFGADGVTYELTGPWPPYNFVDEEEPV
jgi:Gas vesicle synthesis protein GvpL/GvpF